MARCTLCQAESKLIPRSLGVCSRCIRTKPEKALAILKRIHAKSRALFGLPVEAPDSPNGIPCGLCVQQCRIGENQTGYCGLRKNIDGHLTGNDPLKGKAGWYHDPLPTNCVGNWVCPGGTRAGYPEYSYSREAEFGYTNLAVFFHACSFNCLYCQNWHFKHHTLSPEYVEVSQLVEDLTPTTACICFFGGDPSPQLLFSIKTAETVMKIFEDKILRICWETNGSMNETLLDRITDISLVSGGCIKFDLKAWDDSLHRALTGASNQRTVKNFKRVASRIDQRNNPPLLIASTLLVPGFVEEEEVGNIASFIASTNPDIPYSLLAFDPRFEMRDLPFTSKAQAERCFAAAKNAGLTRVKIGNASLLL